MKRNVMMIAVLAISALAVFSCKKEKTQEQETESAKTVIYARMNGSMAGSEKTHLGTTDENDFTPTLWSAGDKVAVYSSSDEGVEFTLKSGDENKSTAAFEGGPLSGSAPFCAFYPYSGLNQKVTLNDGSYAMTFDLPSEQTYSGATFAEGTCPMVAYNSSDETQNYAFKNVMSLLKVNLTGTGVVKKLVLTDNNEQAKLWGTATVRVNTDNPTHEQTTCIITDGGGNMLTLNCPIGVTLSKTEPKTFYFVVPAGTLDKPGCGFKIDVYNKTGKYTTIDKSYIEGYEGHHLMQCSIISDMSEYVELPIPEGALPGLFSVGENKKVYFSKGNLQYNATGSSASVSSGENVGGTWRFAEHQYDYVGGGSPLIGNVSESRNDDFSSNYSGWIDMFGWGTSGYKHGAVCYVPRSNQNDNAKYYAYGSWENDLYSSTGKADWGYNAISNGGNAENSGWRTMKGGSANTQDGEWYYLFNLRPDHDELYGNGTVHGTKGWIIFPDDWAIPSDLDPSFTFTSCAIDPHWPNTISDSDWTILEDNGAVFLPAGGYRNPQSNSVKDVNEIGRYWSSTHIPTKSYAASYVYLGESNPVGNGDETNRFFGFQVRLVYDAEY